MSIPQGPAYREGIWEIRETTITALFPDGPWVLGATDIEYILLQDGTENGLFFCDAFIKPRSNEHPYPVGRYAVATEGICKVLSQFAYWNNVTLTGTAGERSSTVQTGFIEQSMSVRPAPLLSAPSPLKSRRPAINPMPKSPDSSMQTMHAPEDSIHSSQQLEPTEANQETSTEANVNQHPKFDQNPTSGQNPGLGQNPDFNGQEGFTPPPGFTPEPEFKNQMPWYQWMFHPANPNFHKTIIAFSVLGALVLAAIVFGGIRGVRLSSVSWPGIVAFIVISKEIKKRRQSRSHQKGPTSTRQPWNQNKTWNQNQTWSPSEPWQSSTNPWNGGNTETSQPEQPDKTEASQPDPSQTEASQPDPSQTEASQPDPSQTEASQEETANSETSRDREASNPYNPSDASKEAH